MVGFGGGARGPVVTMRRLLGTVAGVAGMGLVGASATRAQVGPGSLGPSPLLFHSPVLEPYVDELPRPDVLPGARTGTHRFHRGLPAAMTLGYGAASYLGPVIARRSADDADLPQ